MMFTVTMPLASMENHCVGSYAAALASPVSHAVRKENAMPVPAAATRKPRRERAREAVSDLLRRVMLLGPLHRGGCLPHGGSDARVGHAAAQVAGHLLVDLRVGDVRIVLQHGSRLHDLAGLAVAAL